MSAAERSIYEREQDAWSEVRNVLSRRDGVDFVMKLEAHGEKCDCGFTTCEMIKAMRAYARAHAAAHVYRLTKSEMELGAFISRSLDRCGVPILRVAAEALQDAGFDYEAETLRRMSAAMNTPR